MDQLREDTMSTTDASSASSLRETIHRRRQRAVQAWADAADALRDSLILIAAGEPIGIPGGQDQTYAFHPHPDHRWLTGRASPGAVLIFDPEAPGGAWHDFEPEVTEAERVWEGREPETIEGTRPLGELEGFLGSQSGRRIVALGAAGARWGSADAERTHRLGQLLLHARRPKDALEIDILRRAVSATGRGFAAAREMLATIGGDRSCTERAIQIELEAAMFRAGAKATGYGTLVGSGPNAAVLHFSPSGRVIRPGELVLIDAGGAIDGYTADVTRTFVAGDASAKAATDRAACARRDLYDIVLQAQIRAIERCRPGLVWRDLHTRTAIDLADGLATMGILRGRGETLVEREAIAMFFPHGIGHMVGLGVRDAGGRQPGLPLDAPPAPTCCGVRLRVDLALEAGYLMTVEPGLYFIPAILNDPARRERFADCVHWSRVDEFLQIGDDAQGIGGVRIEDNILISECGPVNLTAAIEK
jgi:Xaa-Pro aminopeptidase